MTYKVEKFKLLISFTINLVRDIQKKLADGKLSVIEIIQLLPYLHDVRELCANAESIKKELKEITKEENEELVAWLETNYGIHRKRGAGVIDSFFTFVISIKNFVIDITEPSDEGIVLPAQDMSKK